MPNVRSIGAIATIIILAAAAPSMAAAQGKASIATLENSLTSSDWQTRALALEALANRVPEVTAGGLTKLIALLRAELDGTLPSPGAEAGEEEYGQYLMTLNQLISRFNDPRATPLLARLGIALTNASVYQVAMAGDAGLQPLIDTWNRNEYLRPAVIHTMGEMRYYFDSTGGQLSTTGREAISDYMLRASGDAEASLRHSFVDAVEAARDPVFLPIVQNIASNDPARLDGVRYVANDAAPLVPRLEQRRTSSTPASLLQSLQGAQAATCRIGWVSGSGICNSLESKLDAAANALARGNANAASNQLDAFRAEVTAQRGKAVNENAYLLLSDNAQYLISRM